MPDKPLKLDEILKLRNNIEMREALIYALKEAEKRILELENRGEAPEPPLGGTPNPHSGQTTEKNALFTKILPIGGSGVSPEISQKN